MLAGALVLTPEPVNGLTAGGGGQPGAGIGRNAIGRPPLDGGRERLGGRLLGQVQVTEALGHDGDHPRPFVSVSAGDRLERVHRNGRTSTFRLQAFDPSVASLRATSRSGASMIQKPTTYSFDSRNGPSVTSAASAPVVDDGRRDGCAEAAGEHPVAFGLEPVVEHVDGRRFIGRGQAGRVVDHGKQVLHVRIISRGSRCPRWATSHPCYEEPGPDSTFSPPGQIQLDSGQAAQADRSRPATAPITCGTRWTGTVCRVCPVTGSHTRTSESFAHEASRDCPAAAKAHTPHTPPVWPARTCRSSPVTGSQTRIFRPRRPRRAGSAGQRRRTSTPTTPRRYGRPEPARAPRSPGPRPGRSRRRRR